MVQCLPRSYHKHSAPHNPALKFYFLFFILLQVNLFYKQVRFFILSWFVFVEIQCQLHISIDLQIPPVKEEQG